jgi:hypothetical protein
MPLDRAGADEELHADLRVREAVAGEPGDLVLLGVTSSNSRMAVIATHNVVEDAARAAQWYVAVLGAERGSASRRLA